jgi:hypothetical protein
MMGSLVAVGLVLLLLWRLFLFFYDRKEYAKFINESKNAKWTAVSLLICFCFFLKFLKRKMNKKITLLFFIRIIIRSTFKRRPIIIIRLLDKEASSVRTYWKWWKNMIMCRQDFFFIIFSKIRSNKYMRIPHIHTPHAQNTGICQ